MVGVEKEGSAEVDGHAERRVRTGCIPGYSLAVRGGKKTFLIALMAAS